VHLWKGCALDFSSVQFALGDNGLRPCGALVWERAAFCVGWALSISPVHGGTHPGRILRFGLCSGIGPRKGFGRATFEPSHIPYSILGAGLLWMGWFGFNAGSALAANGLAVHALMTTNTAAATAGLVWMLLSWLDNKPSILGIVTGAVVGLSPSRQVRGL